MKNGVRMRPLKGENKIFTHVRKTGRRGELNLELREIASCKFLFFSLSPNFFVRTSSFFNMLSLHLFFGSPMLHLTFDWLFWSWPLLLWVIHIFTADRLLTSSTTGLEPAVVPNVLLIYQWRSLWDILIGKYCIELMDVAYSSKLYTDIYSLLW